MLVKGATGILVNSVFSSTTSKKTHYNSSCRDAHYKCNMVVKQCDLYNENSLTGKVASFYWKSPQSKQQAVVQILFGILWHKSHKD